MTIDVQAMIGLVIATAILGLSPGPAVFATIARAINLGLGRTYLFIAGIVVADFVFALLAMLGLATLISQYEPAFIALKIGGGLYLIYLGYKAWRSSAATRQQASAAPEKGWKIFLSGFLLTASNPKDLLFFVSFLPAFVDLKQITPETLILPAILIVLTFIGTLSVYALGAFKVREWLKNEKSVLWLNRLAAVTMTLVGVAVLLG
jgi:threonine/homoserine/homoserine lactone efflux protein